jgi:RNA polymerase sigma-70 factor, ECF subfamily
LAVHHPAQPVPLRIPQAAARGGGRVEFEEFRTALNKLPADQREALILVGASGFSYEDAASICGCAVGTIKSRVNRARTRLADLLSIDSVDDFGPDRATRAVLAGGGRN